MLNVTNLFVEIDNTIIVNNVSFTVPYGQILAITGPSGIGKTTLLHAVCGLIRVSDGSIQVDDSDITSLPTYKRGIGLVSQTGDLFPTMNVRQNIEFGLRRKRMNKQDRTARVDELLAMVGLSHLEHRHVSHLSGGQARRIALARALAPRPSVLLLDEPLSGLDQDTHDTLATDLFELLTDLLIASVIVTHNKIEFERCNEVITM